MKTAHELIAHVSADLLCHTTPTVRKIVEAIWKNCVEFVEWPQRSLLFAPGVARNQKYHAYSKRQMQAIRSAGVPVDRRSNGPAVMAYLLAGGQRPMRTTSKGWSIHHIYDGNHPFPGRRSSVRAVLHPRLFTESAGLVAIHPIADALADSTPYFAWLLRAEAYIRFRHDPDGVFSGAA